MASLPDSRVPKEEWFSQHPYWTCLGLQTWNEKYNCYTGFVVHCVDAHEAFDMWRKPSDFGMEENPIETVFPVDQFSQFVGWQVVGE